MADWPTHKRKKAKRKEEIKFRKKLNRRIRKNATK